MVEMLFDRVAAGRDIKVQNEIAAKFEKNCIVQSTYLFFILFLGQRRVLSLHPEQLLQRRYQVARRSLSSSEALRLRGQRRAVELRCVAKSGHSSINLKSCGSH